jgi:hypothetical protein
MAVFTAIATAIVGAVTTAGAIFGSTLLFNAVVGVVAAGLAFGTAKLLGVFDVPAVDSRANGTKVQVPPATDNKIGIAYGRNFMSGPITDVAITNGNDTMNYCIALSEVVDGATYTLNQTFWGDKKLVFNGANVTTYTDSNSTTTEDWKDKIRIRVYAGGTASANQIFPTSGAVDATTMMRHWTNTTDYSMEGLVFAMIEVDYDAENGLTGLGAMAFDITNSIHNPGEVLFDYMTNSRYGAGLSNSDIDITSILGTANTQMKGYCDEQITYTPNTGGSTTIDRYQINGYLSTFNSCMDNIDSICKNSATYFTFDGKQGKFKAVPNRPYSTTELTNAFVLNDDNIVSKISLSSTELYQQLNSVTVEFADKNRKDQTNTVVIETASGDRNTGEPDNNLDYRAELVNNNIHAEQLGNIDLNQSRKGMVVDLTTDFSGLQIDAGDVVKLNNTDYGFTDRLFRVMKNTEALGQDGMINCNLLLLEYDDSIYVEPTIIESDEEDDDSEIPSEEEGVILLRTQYGNWFRNVTQTSTSGSGSGAKFIVHNAPNSSTYDGVYVQAGYAGTGYANADVVTVAGNTLFGRSPENDLTFQVAGVNASGNLSLAPGSTQNITGNSAVGNIAARGNVISGTSMGDKAAGGQVGEDPSANVDIVDNTATFRQIIPTETIDLTVTENGRYGVRFDALPIGQVPPGGFDVGLKIEIDVDFANNNTISNFVGYQLQWQNNTTLLSGTRVNTEFVVTEQMVLAQIRVSGYNTMANVGGAPNTVGFTNMELDMFKIQKADLTDITWDYDPSRQIP